MCEPAVTGTLDWLLTALDGNTSMCNTNLYRIIPVGVSVGVVPIAGDRIAQSSCYPLGAAPDHDSHPALAYDPS